MFGLPLLRAAARVELAGLEVLAQVLVGRLQELRVVQDLLDLGRRGVAPDVLLLRTSRRWAPSAIRLRMYPTTLSSRAEPVFVLNKRLQKDRFSCFSVMPVLLSPCFREQRQPQLSV
jgi:hypothetical protein